MKELDLRSLLNEYNNIFIFTHLRPDGDAIGSSLALAGSLEQKAKEVKVFCPDNIPAKYSFLPGVQKFRDFFQTGEEGLAFVLDCSDLKRLDYLANNLLRLNKIINIDHHLTNERFGHLNLIDPLASSTGEIIYRFLHANNLELNKEISLCLYVAIASDTGSFKYESTTPQTMEIAGNLLANGVDPSFVSRKLFDEYPLSTILLLRDCLATLQLDETKKIAWMDVKEEMLIKHGARPEELDGFVNYAKNIYGVEVGVLFYHTDNGETKIAFRSKNINVAAIAHSFGGGGHARAAGCTLTGEADDIRKKVLESIQNGLKDRV